ncbi:NAD(P)-binding protein [Caloramator quimbayensis]|uniref:NAD(P)-binding protein n=1 Tax=Caloramator quimbayensis TaxID=1147123 RepID=UPI001FA81F4D|nr:NAD(P)-binding protein [Caloramator quimbayensis]
MSLIRVNINNREIVTTDDKTILQIALENGIDIPNLCYNQKTKPYGSCGLCVVEVEGSPKLVRACSTYPADGMIVRTDTKRTIAARKTALELLSSDHRGDCRPPCVNACPAHTDCQGYVGLIANGEYDEAIKLVKKVIPLPASIGRVCPHPCESECRRGMVDKPIAIADLKRYIGEIDVKKGTFVPEVKPSTGKKVAIVGAGPAGISCAYFLSQEGHEVVIYEAQAYPGGMLRYGIPQYRLPKELLDAEINTLNKMGVEIICNTKLGEDITLSYLKKTYDAVFIAIGAWASMPIGCEGQDMEGVIGGIEFLRKATLSEPIYLGEKVVVIGGGNTAMDVARTAVRLGAKSVQVLYRRTKEEMPAEEIEVKEAEEEGVEFKFLVAPIEIIGDGKRAKAIRCQKMKLGEPDKSGRRSPIPIEGEEITFEADLIVSAIGQRVNPECVKELETTKRGTILVNSNTFETSMEGIFAGGEASTGPKIAIEAIAQGKNAAHVIDSYLNGCLVSVKNPCYIVQDDLKEEDFKDREKQERQEQYVIKGEERKISFRPISNALTEEQALKEASRCLECGCHDYFECRLINYIQKYDIKVDKIKGEKHKRDINKTHPFIVRNPDKCILCGLCYRTCEEVMGITALGLKGRGFDSVVIPEFNLPLNESSCISCGQCVDVCPTGALIDTASVKKQVPVEFNNTKSVCSYCGAGCEVVYQSKGDLVFKSLPDKEKGGILCAKGRFGIEHINSDERLKTPFVVSGDIKSEVTFDEALSLISKKAKLIEGQYGKDSIGILVSPKFTNEEAYIIRKIAEKLNTKYVGSMAIKGGALEKVFGYNASTNSYDELYSTELIISFGNVAENHPVPAVRIKDASKKAKLISICDKYTRMNEWAHYSYKVDNNIDFLKGFLKALIENHVDENEVIKTCNNFYELKNFVSDVKISEDNKRLAKMYAEAKKAIIVVDEDTITDAALCLLADAAAICRKVGKPHSGIIIIRSKANSQGFIDMGIKMSGKAILEKAKSGEIKGLIVFGEDVSDELKDLKPLAVFDLLMTDTAKNSNIVVPLSASAEGYGTYTRSDRKVQALSRAVESAIGIDNFNILLKLSNKFGIELKDMKDVVENISKEIINYKGLNKAYNNLENVYVPLPMNFKGVQVLYTEGFETEDKKADLNFEESNSMFLEKKLYDTVEKDFDEFTKKNGINI